MNIVLKSAKFVVFTTGTVSLIGIAHVLIKGRWSEFNGVIDDFNKKNA